MKHALSAVAFGFAVSASASVTTDFEAYGYINSPRDYFGLIDDYAYLPGATILDVSPGSSVYGWLAPAHSGRYVLADSRSAITISGESFDSVSLWVRAWIPGTTGSGRIVGTSGLVDTYTLDYTFDNEWKLISLTGSDFSSVRIEHSAYLFLDDITFSQATAAISAPSTLSMVALAALLGLLPCLRSGTTGSPFQRNALRLPAPGDA